MLSYIYQRDEAACMVASFLESKCVEIVKYIYLLVELNGVS